jgi:hypothetical protein
MNIPGYLTEAEQAARLGKRPRTLQLWRKLGIGPAYTRSGRTVLYTDEAEKEYLKAQEQTPVRSRHNRDRSAVQRRHRAAGGSVTA